MKMMNLSHFFQAPFNAFIVRVAPLWFATGYLNLIGAVYYIVNRRERDRIKRNIATVFAAERSGINIARRTFEGIYSHYAEKLLMAYRDLDELTSVVGNKLRYEGLEHLEQALGRGGVILVTGHFGAVEYMPLVLHIRNYPVTMVVACTTNRLWNSLVERAEKNNVHLIDGHGGNILGQMLDALKQGRIVVTECDEVDAWRTNGRDTIPAFGLRVLRDRTMSIISRRSHATVLCAFLLREAGGYHFVIEPVDDVINETGDVFRGVFQVLERKVMQCPDQWYQWKKFHKMLPEYV